jgi:hypothetical protein
LLSKRARSGGADRSPPETCVRVRAWRRSEIYYPSLHDVACRLACRLHRTTSLLLYAVWSRYCTSRAGIMDVILLLPSSLPFTACSCNFSSIRSKLEDVRRCCHFRNWPREIQAWTQCLKALIAICANYRANRNVSDFEVALDVVAGWLD